MSRLEESQRRLAEAVKRLESALADDDDGKAGVADREMTELREAHEALRVTADAVAERLDKAIAEVDRMIEHRSAEPVAD